MGASDHRVPQESHFVKQTPLATARLNAAAVMCTALFLAVPAFTLTKSIPAAPTTLARTLLETATPVQQIPAARSAGDLTTVDLTHVLLSTADEVRYMLTLNRDCPELRWARHIGITASGNTIWAGFDALTADGQACQIREIHRLGVGPAQRL